jgi:hypothetical protein
MCLRTALCSESEYVILIAHCGPPAQNARPKAVPGAYDQQRFRTSTVIGVRLHHLNATRDTGGQGLPGRCPGIRSGSRPRHHRRPACPKASQMHLNAQPSPGQPRDGQILHKQQSMNGSRVEVWRGGLGDAKPVLPLSVGSASRASPCSVSTPRSSNLDGRISRIRLSDQKSRGRPRKVLRSHAQFYQT